MDAKVGGGADVRSSDLVLIGGERRSTRSAGSRGMKQIGLLASQKTNSWNSQ